MGTGGAQREPRAPVAASRARADLDAVGVRADVLDARRHLGVGMALDDPLFLQRAQAQAERARADAGEGALQLAEARAALGEVADQQEGPLAAHDLCGGADWTGLVHTSITLPNE